MELSEFLKLHSVLKFTTSLRLHEIWPINVDEYAIVSFSFTLHDLN